MIIPVLLFLTDSAKMIFSNDSSILPFSNDFSKTSIFQWFLQIVIFRWFYQNINFSMIAICPSFFNFLTSQWFYKTDNLSMILPNVTFFEDYTKSHVLRNDHLSMIVTRVPNITCLPCCALLLSHISPLVHFLAQHAAADSEGDPCPAPSSLDMEIWLLLSNGPRRRGFLAGHWSSCHSTIRSPLSANQISFGDNILFQPRQISWCRCRKTYPAWRSFVGAWLPDAFPYWLHKQR